MPGDRNNGAAADMDYLHRMFAAGGFNDTTIVDRKLFNLIKSDIIPDPASQKISSSVSLSAAFRFSPPLNYDIKYATIRQEAPLIKFTS